MDQSKLNYYDSNVESNGIVESPSNEVHLKGDRDNIVFMEKSQEYANISDNLEPRCSSNKELNDVNDVNEKNSDADVSATSEDGFYDAVEGSPSSDLDSSSTSSLNALFSDALDLNSSNCGGDVSESSDDVIVSAGSANIAPNTNANDDSSSSIGDEFDSEDSYNDSDAEDSCSDSSCSDSNAEDSYNDSNAEDSYSDSNDYDSGLTGTVNENISGYGYEDEDSSDDSYPDHDESGYHPHESFELNDSLRAAIEKEAIESNTFAFQYVTRASVSDDSIEACSVCLAPFVDQEAVRRLPCWHLFHTACIDTWLKQKRACPKCLTNIDTAANFMIDNAI